MRYHFVVRDGARIEHEDGAVLPDDEAAPFWVFQIALRARARQRQSPWFVPAHATCSSALPEPRARKLDLPAAS
jgi:hypothetical protein